MKLSELLNISSTGLTIDPEIKDIQLDSRQIKKGDLFFALPGSHENGAQYIKGAIENGAVAIAVDAEISLEPSLQKKIEKDFIAVVSIQNLKENLGCIAAKFFNYPANEMMVVGITGTNGKTSTCYLIAEALEKLGRKVAIIGTLGYGQLQHLQSTGMTTPDVITLQRIFAYFKSENIQYVVMEVSSHALDQYRVIGIPFNIAIFSNLTRDHLDYHQTMENYANAKRKLFDWPSLQACIINADDEYGYTWLKGDLKGSVIAYGETVRTKTFSSAYQINQLQISADGTHFVLSNKQEIGIQSKLLGRFNAYNLTAAILALHCLNINWTNIKTILPKLEGVPGRMQVLKIPNKPTVIIDFAHTPDALEQVLKSIHELSSGNIICVFGCGGDRDRGKRPLMAKIAENLSNKIIVTSDNPRTEDPMAIINEICTGFQQQKYQIEIDREKAIKKAIAEAKEGDIVLLAGKGHETYQIIGKEILPFDDYLIAKECLLGK